jgi:hypothetical protein
MGNWFSRLFAGKPQLTLEEKQQRLKPIEQRMVSALLAFNQEEMLRCGNELIELAPDQAFGWETKIKALEKLGRQAEANATRQQALRAVAK